jgi:hypothetical protein
MAKQSNEIELILQDCLEKIQSEQETLEGVLARYPQFADELRPAIESALWLRARKQGLEPRPGYVSASRRRLVEQIKQEQAAAPTSAGVKWVQFWRGGWKVFQTRRLAFQLAVAVVLVFAMISSSAGIARAAQNSLPGESLFPVKLAIEEAQVMLTPDAAARAAQQVERTQQRLFEIESLLMENREEHIATGVQLFENQVNTTVRMIVQVQDLDQEKARQLASSLSDTLRDQYVVIRVLTSTASPAVAADLDRLLQITGGVIDLVQETVPTETEPAVVIATPVPSATTPLVQVVPSSTPVLAPTSAPVLLPTQVFAVTAVPTIDFTATLTTTAVIVPVEDDTNITPTPTEVEKVKATKEPKPTKEKKPKKDLPEPTRRPPRPTR